jgi:deoxyribose-phosphate aldolase
MDLKRIAHAVDHTLLDPCCTTAQLETLCREARRFEAASVCVPPCHVEEAAGFLEGALPVCTVVGFPNGYSTRGVKCAETREAIALGASEIDMVANLCRVREGRFDLVEEEIRAVKEICGERILKVIIETCRLTEEEKCLLCSVVAAAGADFIKTSTGFGGGGATFEDVALLRQCSPASLRVKASGGIGTLEDAQRFLDLGAERLGASRLLRLIAEAEDRG